MLFSDIPNKRIMRFSEDDRHFSVFRQLSMDSNGDTIDREGRLITCEHSGRRAELDGSITVIADKYNGKRLNSPNDAASPLTVRSGLPIQFMESVAITRANLNKKNTMSTGSTRNPKISQLSSMSSWSPTHLHERTKRYEAMTRS